ncbi:MraY-like glycosyltransferase [Gimesia alba]|uniref:MraY-like glycosyltransferase n=1 Tax=Gimesia alba TaxID=2527973 RepID=A0A517RBS9_9PLAN|nr:O-antigen ligase family protein [Gimesia alba]QDT41303.1 MraY-like glycosyltransferase [Gimesia alba]
MSKRRKQNRSQSTQATSTSAAPAFGRLSGLLNGIQLFLIGTLITARYFLPAESAPQGETLAITFGWFILAILFCGTLLTERTRVFRADRYDLGVWLLVLGQVISTLVMIYTAEGQQRAALNMMWEWVGLGLTFSLTRRLIATTSLRTTLLQGFLTTIVLLSIYGIWQHHWMYDQLAQEYLSVRQQYDAADSPAERARFQQQLNSMGVPADSLTGSGQKLFEQRLLDSSEPLGMFALANTFAGLLAVGFLITFAQTIPVLFSKTANAASKSDRFKSWILVLPTILIGYCLILTKSRTAWVGVMGGLVSLALLKLIQKRQGTKEQRALWKKQALKWGIGGMIVVLGFFLLATFSGGFDRAVLTEAPKSLQYRLEYWTGTWDVIQENPLWGTGPGNFRNHYLKHKLPGSSEEISDPHNMFLDVWANAGLIAFAGLLAILALAAYRWLIKPLPVSENTELNTSAPHLHFSPDQILLLLGFVLSFPLLWGEQLFLQSIDEIRLWLFCLGWLVIFFTLNVGWQALHESDWKNSAASFVPLALASAFVALCIHLLGAGGIAMPAVTQTWLLLLAFAFPVTTPLKVSEKNETTSNHSVPALPFKTIHLKTASFIFCLLITFFFIRSSFAPTIERKNLVREGEQVLLRGNSARIAQRYFQQASQADPLSPAPWQALAELEFRQGAENRDAFEQGVKLSQAAIQRDPKNPLNYFQLGQHFYQQYQTSQKQEDLDGALENLKQAVSGYPHNARYRAAYAEALFAARQTRKSHEQAERAVELDEANRRAQHVDKYLNDETLSRMKEIINVTQTNQN